MESRLYRNPVRPRALREPEPARPCAGAALLGTCPPGGLHADLVRYDPAAVRASGDLAVRPVHDPLSHDRSTCIAIGCCPSSQSERDPQRTHTRPRIYAAT